MLLMAIHAYFSPIDIPQALRIARELHVSYPDNAILHFELIEVLLKAGRHDELVTEALALERRRGESPGVTGRGVLARIWRARSAIDIGDVETARPIAFGTAPDDPDLPDWGLPWLRLVRAQVLDLEGDRVAALTSYERVVALESGDFDTKRPVRMAKAGIEAPYAPGDATDGAVFRSRD